MTHISARPVSMLDGTGPPTLFRAYAHTNNKTHMLVKGEITPHDTVHMILWPKDPTQRWKNPCTTFDVCCPRDAMKTYLTSLDSSATDNCYEFFNQSKPASTFQVHVPLNTPWVACLFAHQNPTYFLASKVNLNVISLQVEHVKAHDESDLQTFNVWEIVVVMIISIALVVCMCTASKLRKDIHTLRKSL